MVDSLVREMDSRVTFLSNSLPDNSEPSQELEEYLLARLSLPIRGEEKTGIYLAANAGRNVSYQEMCDVLGCGKSSLKIFVSRFRWNISRRVGYIPDLVTNIRGIGYLMPQKYRPLIMSVLRNMEFKRA